MDELPGYFDTPEAEPAARARRGGGTATPPPPPSHAARLDLVPIGAATSPLSPTLVVVQVVPLRPDVAAAGLVAWAADAARRCPWHAGPDRVRVVDAAEAVPGVSPCCRYHVRVDVRRRAGPALAMAVGCSPWSATRAELHVVPARAVHDRRRYFRAAHAVLDRLVRELR